MQLATHLSHPIAAPTGMPVCWTDMVAHRKDLVRFAQRRLQDPMLAEDVVHDVFEAVLSGRAAFAGRAALRSWLTALLKNKIVDLVRQRAGLHSLDQGRQQTVALQGQAAPGAGAVDELKPAAGLTVPSATPWDRAGGPRPASPGAPPDASPGTDGGHCRCR